MTRISSFTPSMRFSVVRRLEPDPEIAGTPAAATTMIGPVGSEFPMILASQDARTT